MEILKNSRLILNGHKIFNVNQLFDYFSKKFQEEINSESDVKKKLKCYSDLNIVIRHSDSFLKNESQLIHDRIIKIFKSCGFVKETGKK